MGCGHHMISISLQSVGVDLLESSVSWGVKSVVKIGWTMDKAVSCGVVQSLPRPRAQVSCRVYVCKVWDMVGDANTWLHGEAGTPGRARVHRVFTMAWSGNYGASLQAVSHLDA